MLRAYNFLRLLSLDVVAGAVILALFIGKYLEVSIPTDVLIGLGGSVWLVYVVDHLVDAQKIKHKPNTYRHRFHQKYAKVLSILSATAFCALAYLATQVPFVIVKSAAILVLFLICYFVFIWFGKVAIPKEIVVAIIYTLGVFLAPFSLNGYHLDSFGVMLFANLWLLAFLNLFLFSFFDMDKDKLDGHTSMPLRLGEEKSASIFQVLSFLLLLFDLELIFLFRDDFGKMVIIIVFLMMHLFLICLFSFKSFFGQKEKYRIMGDAMFYLPALLLL